jgi:hypothetical protein
MTCKCLHSTQFSWRILVVPSAAIYRLHNEYHYYRWDDLRTLWRLDDVHTDDVGLMRDHPKVYAGFWTHASFRSKCAKGCGVCCLAESWSYRSTCNHKKPTDLPLSELTHRGGIMLSHSSLPALTSSLSWTPNPTKRSSRRRAGLHGDIRAPRHP